MSDVAVTNTTSGLSGKSLLATDVDATVTALHSFNRGSGSAPFAVNSGATVVSNLDADKVDGIEGSALLAKAGGTMTGALIAAAGTVSAPGLAVSGATNGVYASGTNALDIATNGTKALGIDSTQFIDSPTQPRASAYHNTTQSINNSTQTVLSLNAEDFDVSTMHDTVTNNSRMTIPTGGDGLYWIYGAALFAASATGVRRLDILKNGSAMASTQYPNAGADSVLFPVSALLVLSAADYVELAAVQTSGGALNVGNATRQFSTSLQVVKLW